MSISEAQAASWVGTSALPAASSAAADTSTMISALVEEYSASLYRVAYSVSRNAAEAEDAVQETFLRVLRHQEQLGEIRDLRVWLVRITWNVVLDRKRRTKTRPETEDIADLAHMLPADGLKADERVIAAQQHAHVLALIERLPRKEREVLLLSAFEELSTPQIAAVVGTTDSSVRSRLFRARRLLAGWMEKNRT
ncbi:MAG TPA: RNA polymerase sigma factor [Acidisarcina sp.]|nr:RNA polymerase sigma factor [Acidisarcina sp.]